MTVGVKRQPVLAATLLVALLATAGRAAEPRLLATLHGREPEEHLGGAMSMSAAGDVSGDGLADLLVGDAREGWFPGERRCYLYYGRPVLDTVPDVIIPQCEADTTEPHSDDDDKFGAVVDGGHDVNGDGFDDIVITSPWWYWWTGKVYLYHGGAPLDTDPDVAIAAWGSSWMTSFWSTGLRGPLVGDVNGDGYDELVCLAGWVSADAGAHVYYGGAPMDSVHDLSLQGPGYPEMELGRDMACGDVNGDGYGDIVVTSYATGNPHSRYEDAAWVYLGGTQMDTIPDVRLGGSGELGWGYTSIPGDINGDGFSDIVISEGPDSGHVYIYFGGAPMDSLADIHFVGTTTYDPPRVAGGDLDQDGYADLLVAQTGRLAAYLGGAEMDTVPDFEVTAPDSFGRTIAFLGDMTGDGWPEFAVSDPEGPGAIYIYTLAPEAAGEEPAGLLPQSSLLVVPTPTRGPVSIWWNAADVTGSPELAVYDVAGHLMRRFLRREGSQVVCWDLRSTSGSPVSPGTYVIRLQSGQGTAQPGAGRTQSARLVVTR